MPLEERGQALLVHRFVYLGLDAFSTTGSNQISYQDRKEGLHCPQL